jgi:RNA polymerase sigma factor (sigma-70 family)
VNDQTDSQLLCAYAEHRSEAAFAELVRRHVDLVYSAALRMVCDSHLAEDVTQGVFVALARQAAQLGNRPVLSGWLHRTAQNIASQTVRTIERRRTREQEAAIMNELLSASSESTLENIAPHLDAALGGLSEPDRDAIMLRYFERKSAQEMAQTLGISDEASQKRVSRAIERLREFFIKRGLTVSVSGIIGVISTNAIHAAPVGLAARISTFASAGTTIVTGTATKAIVMTTLQKSIATVVVTTLVGVAIYEARQVSTLRSQNQALQQQQQPLGDEVQRLQRERDEALRRLVSLQQEKERVSDNTGELLRLRGEVARLRNTGGSSGSAGSAPELMDTSNPLWKPNWIVLRPFNLGQFPDSGTMIKYQEAKESGIATPASLLQTWIWAQRTRDVAGILRTWDFPDDTTEEEKMKRAFEAKADEEYAQQHPDQIGHAETSKLRDLFELGDGLYLAFIEESGLTTGPWVSHQILRRVGDEWKFTFRRHMK